MDRSMLPFPIRCADCFVLLSDEYCRDDPPPPCPSCGSTKLRLFDLRELDLGAELDGRTVVKMRMKLGRPGMSRGKGWTLRTTAELVPQVSRDGALARVDRTFSHDTDWYEETVVLDTGEILHHCAEPLSQHRGHGSARRKQNRSG